MPKGRFKSGYSMVEIIMYVTILSFLVFIVVGMLVRISHTKDRLTAAQRLTNSAIVSLDRMTREINSATNINVASSTLNTSPGRLILMGNESGTAYTTEFSIASGTLRILRNGVDQGPLTESGVVVTHLVFRRSASSTDQAISLELGLESGTSTSYKAETFYTTNLLRQSL